jgi:translation initiation factor IF-2
MMTKKKDIKSKKTPSKSEEKKEDLFLREGTTIKELADILEIKGRALLDKLAAKRLELSMNDIITPDLTKSLSRVISRDIEIISAEENIRRRIQNEQDKLVTRPPVVTIMGHVDHGKTTLLDAIRKSNLVRRESGGITQHIGAYQITVDNKKITFIDTPGHEAFTQLRARGAKLTDIVILVVAADDGLMPQTKEAIQHARAAGVPIMVAINKIDKANANIDRVKQQLSKEELLTEDWGGETISVEISATEKTNLAELLEMIVLLSDMEEIKGHPGVPAQGVVLEARLDTSKGPVGTVIVQNGVLKRGDVFISGTTIGKVKALFDEKGKGANEAGLSTPIEIMGFTDVPVAGELIQVLPDMELAKRIVDYRKSQKKEREESGTSERMTLDQLFKNIEEGETKELHLIVKTDVHGSAEVLEDILPNLSTDEVKVNLVACSTGKITESDINLATTTEAIIIGYNTKPSKKTADLAKKEGIEIRVYTVIYELIDDIKLALKGMLEPVKKEIYLGKAQVKRTFRISKVGLIAGCLVKDGKIVRNAKAKVIRNGNVIHEGKISSLKHLKENVAEIKKDYECGIGIQNFNDIQAGDVIEAFSTEMVAPE